MLTQINENQQVLLQEHSKQFPFMCHKLIFKLAKDLNLKPKTIFKWFKAQKCIYLKKPQIEILQKSFENCPKITKEISIKMSKEINIAPEIIIRWFKIQNGVSRQIQEIVLEREHSLNIVKQGTFNKDVVKHFMFCNCEDYCDSFEKLENHLNQQHESSLFNTIENSLKKDKIAANVKDQITNQFSQQTQQKAPFPQQKQYNQQRNFPQKPSYTPQQKLNLRKQQKQKEMFFAIQEQARKLHQIAFDIRQVLSGIPAH